MSMFTTEYLGLYEPLAEEIKSYRDRNQCSVFEAQAALRKNRLIIAATYAATVDELRDVILEMLAPQPPRG